MKWRSNRGQAALVSTSEALRTGLASDGGLFMPVEIPQGQGDTDAAYPEFALQCLTPYFEGDPLLDKLSSICENAFNFPVPINVVQENTALLELFHGPTLAFKDFGARFLAECMRYLTSTEKQTLIMVATSGDTGSAVASAFYQQPNIRVVVLYPQGQITPRQEQQIACWGENILALSVQGTFDDCQKIVKSAFQDQDIHEQWDLSSANSINIGRLLPQIVYYAYTAVKLAARDIEPPTLIVPSGNLGNVTAAHMAKHMGYPIGKIIAVTNANQALLDYVQTGEYHARGSIQTLANAMDVGDPSNFTRLQTLYPEHADFAREVKTLSVTDQQIRDAITDCYQQTEQIICPHTATAWHAAQQCTQDDFKVIAATAHPCKFESTVEPLLETTIPLPETMQDMLSRPLQSETVAASLEAVKQTLHDL